MRNAKMTKRHIYKGMYTRFRSNVKLPAVTYIKPQSSSVPKFADRASSCLWNIYSAMFGNYVAIVSVLLILLFSYLVPDMSHKRNATSELKTIKKVLDKMSNEVKRAEVACLTVANEICCLQCSVQDDTTETQRNPQDLSLCTSRCMHATQSEPVQVEKKSGFLRRIFLPNRNASHKEVTIMSYVYTDSFDGTTNKTDTIINIGRTYDKLDSKLKSIFKVVDINHAPREPHPKRLHQKKYEPLRYQDEYNLDRRTLHDIQVHAALKAKRHNTEAPLKPDTHHKTYRKDKATGPLGKNATTITQYPLKSIGLTSDLSKYEIINKYCLRDKDTFTCDTHECTRQHGYWDN